MADLEQLIKQGIFDVVLDVANPSLTSDDGYDAGDGVIAKATDNTRWIKIGDGNYDWRRLPLIDSETGKIDESDFPDLIIAGLRQGTRDELDAADPTLLFNEPAWETDTGGFRVGKVRFDPAEMAPSPHANLTIQIDNTGAVSMSLVEGEFTGADSIASASHASFGRGVTSIADGAFAENSLTSISISNSVTAIGNHVFIANSLGSVKIPDSVTTIGDGAFSENSLTSVVIPDSVTSIGGAAFAGNSLTSVTIPDGVTSLGESAFGDNSLTSVVIPDSVTSIGTGAFAGNSLTSVTIPDGVTSLGETAFMGNALTSVTIPASVTSLGPAVFLSNSGLASVNAYVTKTLIDSADSIFTDTAPTLTIHARSSDSTWTTGTGLTIGGNTNVTVIKDI